MKSLIKLLCFLLIVISGCDESDNPKSDNDKVSIESNCYPVALDVVDSEYYILGFSIDTVERRKDLSLITYDGNTNKAMTTTIQYASSSDFIETPYSIQKYNDKLIISGKYNHWDDFSDIYLYPYIGCFSENMSKIWEAEIGYRRRVSNKFHIINNDIYLAEASFSSGHMALTIEKYGLAGGLLETYSIDSADISVCTSVSLNNAIVVVGGGGYMLDLISVGLNGTENWRTSMTLNAQVNFNSIIAAGDNLIINGNKIDNNTGMIYQYDANNDSLFLLVEDDSMQHINMITSDGKLFVLGKTTSQSDNIEYAVLIYSYSGELLDELTLDDYQNCLSLAFNKDVNNNIYFAGWVNNKVLITSYKTD